MPTLTNDDILDAIGNLTVVQLAELLKAFEEKFGVTAAAPVAVAAAPAAGGGEAAGEQGVVPSPGQPRRDRSADTNTTQRTGGAGDRCPTSSALVRLPQVAPS